MSEPIKLYIKEIEVQGDNDFTLDSIDHDNNNLYDSSSGPTVDLGSGSYEFEIEIYLVDVNGVEQLMHQVPVSQTDPDETAKPVNFGSGLQLPNSESMVNHNINKESNPSQTEPDETAKPGNLPGKPGIF